MTDPNWPRAKEWLEGRARGDAAVASLAVLGVPLHRASISQSRADLAPAAIRTALFKYSVYDVERGTDLRSIGVQDAGDLMLFGISPEDALAPVSQRIRELKVRSDVVVALGGDNSITRPVMHGLGALDRLGLITFDAHFDLRELEDGLTNGNPVRALLADGLPGPHIAQIGIQPFANSPRHAEIAREAGIHVFSRDEVERRGIDAVVTESLERVGSQVDAIHVDIDVDVLDRAFAPATPGARPGGLSPLELRRAVTACGAHPKVIAADIVEVSPPDDVAEVTSMTAAQLLLAFASGVAARASTPS
jgi:formiminoglutamase